MDDQLPNNLEGLLPGMTCDFKTYVDVLPKTEEPRPGRPGDRELVFHPVMPDLRIHETGYRARLILAQRSVSLWCQKPVRE